MHSVFLLAQRDGENFAIFGFVNENILRQRVLGNVTIDPIWCSVLCIPEEEIVLFVQVCDTSPDSFPGRDVPRDWC